MLRNPAYKGTACFGKTEIAERKKITRPLRKRGGFSQRCSANRERPNEEWIEIAVPSIMSNNIFALAQERLEKNKQFSSRRTREPTLLQGILVCSRLLNAFQEGIMELPELRVHIQGLRKREIALKSELHSLEVKMVEQGTYLQLVKNMIFLIAYVSLRNVWMCQRDIKC